MFNLRAALRMRNPNATRTELHRLGVWITADGRRIHVSKIDNRHLVNIAGYLFKSAQAEAARLMRFYLHTPGPQGEMAQVAFEQEMDFWCYDAGYGDPVTYLLESHPFHPHLERELKKRGLFNDREDESE